MDKEIAESLSEKLADGVKSRIKTFLSKEPLEQLNYIKDELWRLHEPPMNMEAASHPLTKVIEQIIKDLIDEANERNDDEYWKRIYESFWSRLDYYFQISFHNYFRYAILYVILSHELSSILDRKYLSEVKEKNGIKSNKVLKELLAETFLKGFYDEIKRGGKKPSFWNKHNRLTFLAYYNRFMFVIKNARNDLKDAQKKKIENSKTLNHIEEKYQIPEHLLKELNSLQSNADLALSWAKREMNLDQNEEYLKDVLKTARKAWFTNKNDKTEQQKQARKQFVLIDTNYDTERLRRFYAVHKKDAERIKRLTYTTVAKSFADINEYEAHRRKYGEEEYIFRLTMGSE